VHLLGKSVVGIEIRILDDVAKITGTQRLLHIQEMS
jgi:hypothetical protein